MTRLKYFNTLAPPTNLYIILHFIQLTVDKYYAGQQLHKCSYALKFKILRQEMTLYEFLSHIYIIW